MYLIPFSLLSVRSLQLWRQQQRQKQLLKCPQNTKKESPFREDAPVTQKQLEKETGELLTKLQAISVTADPLPCGPLLPVGHTHATPGTGRSGALGKRPAPSMPRVPMRVEKQQRTMPSLWSWGRELHGDPRQWPSEWLMQWGRHFLMISIGSFSYGDQVRKVDSTVQAAEDSGCHSLADNHSLS